MGIEWPGKELGAWSSTGPCHILQTRHGNCWWRHNNWHLCLDTIKV